jgi:hypothetical protein
MQKQYVEEQCRATGVKPRALWSNDNDAEVFSEIVRTTAGLDETDMVMLVHELAKRCPEDEDD